MIQHCVFYPGAQHPFSSVKSNQQEVSSQFRSSLLYLCAASKWYPVSRHRFLPSSCGGQLGALQKIVLFVCLWVILLKNSREVYHSLSALRFLFSSSCLQGKHSFSHAGYSHLNFLLKPVKLFNQLTKQQVFLRPLYTSLVLVSPTSCSHLHLSLSPPSILLQ